MVVFVVTHALGDPARLMLPLEATEEEVDAFRHAMGFDDPLYEQFFRFAKGAIRGDFGDSLWQRVPALSLVIERMPASFLLSLTAIVLAIGISIPLGIFASLRPRSLLDQFCTALSLTGICVPAFWLGIMLIILFAVKYRLFYTSGYGTWRHLVLPAIALAALPLGRITQIVRSSMMDELHRQYIKTARGKGLAERTVILRHALKNAAIPIVTLAAWELTRMLAGYTVMVEAVFAWPGFGLLAVQAIERHDLPVIQADVFVVALIVVVMNISIDLLYGSLDPRVRIRG